MLKRNIKSKIHKNIRNKNTIFFTFYNKNLIKDFFKKIFIHFKSLILTFFIVFLMPKTLAEGDTLIDFLTKMSQVDESVALALFAFTFGCVVGYIISEKTSDEGSDEEDPSDPKNNPIEVSNLSIEREKEKKESSNEEKNQELDPELDPKNPKFNYESARAADMEKVFFKDSDSSTNSDLDPSSDPSLLSKIWNNFIKPIGKKIYDFFCDN